MTASPLATVSVRVMSRLPYLLRIVRLPLIHNVIRLQRVLLPYLLAPVQTRTLFGRRDLLAIMRLLGIPMHLLG